MSVTIRLTRMGRHKRPFYRIVVADSRMPRDGKYIEILGTYNPLLEPSSVTIDNEKAVQWLMKGAQMSDTVRNLFKKHSITKTFRETKTNTAAG